MKYLLIPILLLIPAKIKYQSIYTDCRDGQQYKVIRIGNLDWFAEDLRYVAPKSWCEEHPSPLCDETNFYAHTQLDSICPCEWRLPTVEEWLSVVRHSRDLRAISKDSLDWVKYTGISKGGRTVIDYEIEKFDLIQDTHTLNL